MAVKAGQSPESPDWNLDLVSLWFSGWKPLLGSPVLSSSPMCLGLKGAAHTLRAGVGGHTSHKHKPHS